MDKQKLISFTSQELKIIKEFAEFNKLSEYNAIKEIIRRYGNQLK